MAEPEASRGPRLVAACWTTAGDVAPGDVDAVSPVEFSARVAAAAAAGFTGLGLNHPDLVAARDRHGDAGMRAILSGHGIDHLELEVLTGWYATGPERAAADERRRTLLDAAEKLGAKLVKVIAGIGASGGETGPVVEAFHELAALAAGAGTRIGIEPVAVCEIATPAQALDLVRAAGHPAGGVVLDNWQIARAGVDTARLRDFPAEWIASVELSDGPRVPTVDFVDDCYHHRGLPGSGELEVTDFVAAVRKTRYAGVWGVEILDAGYRTQPVEAATASAYEAAIAVL
ncbi:sugar phosphate isomerase/epimerase family protein [Amycolatopsis jejuensis]|uniref:sugar phosphate isomerase/epimerase family protein n=1 Tax=Amycolatopsis jejuensis TaxID=330084 RepID=UPI0005266BC6|nr:sugar phosphate isomerase/epimerase [Amycolatopsis jejuensis]